MKSKHTYRCVEIQKVDADRLLGLLPALMVIVAIDVAKRKQVAAFCGPEGRHELLVRFEHPAQTPAFMGLLERLVEARRTVQVVMEPTGTYGDILCHEAQRRGAEVYLINPKKTHDAAEVFDGVPSYHDSKDATVVGRLHAQGVSRRWRPQPEERRELRALVTRRELYARQVEVLHGELEALLSRHWPELQEVLDCRQQKSALALLMKYPDPRQVGAAPEPVQELLRTSSRGNLSRDKVEALVAGARGTQGVAMVPGEKELVKQVAGELVRLEQHVEEMDRLLRDKVSAQLKWTQAAAMVGMTTLAVILSHVGDPADYSSAGALEKAMGLNLREASSGEKSRRGLHITKRGPGIVRKYLYMATLRWLQKDPIAVAWYKGRQGYTEKTKGRAVVALMRKLVRGLWHLSRGASYEAERLFDTRRLKGMPLPAKKPQEARDGQEVRM